MLTGGEMLYVGIRRRDRFRIHGGVAIVLPVLQMVHEIKRQIGELRFQLAGDAFGFFGERGAVFCEPLRGLGALEEDVVRIAALTGSMDVDIQKEFLHRQFGIIMEHFI